MTVLLKDLDLAHVDVDWCHFAGDSLLCVKLYYFRVFLSAVGIEPAAATKQDV